jgi:hypothetical protein
MKASLSLVRQETSILFAVIRFLSSRQHWLRRVPDKHKKAGYLESQPLVGRQKTNDF